MKSINVCEYSRSRTFHDDLILHDQLQVSVIRTNGPLVCLFIFSGTIGIRVIIFKGEDIGNMLPICISNALLNMCSEPFVMVLNASQDGGHIIIWSRDLPGG